VCRGLHYLAGARAGADRLRHSHRVQMPGHSFGRIQLRDFLAALARKVEKREATMVEYDRIRAEERPVTPAKPEAKLTRTEIFGRSARW